MSNKHTLKFTQGLQNLIKSAPKEKVNEIYDMLEHYILIYSKQIEDNIIAAERAQFFNILVDLAFKNLFKQDPEIEKSISCKAGCFSCCKNLINVITFDEACLLYEYAVQNNIEIPLDKLIKQANHPTLEKWKTLDEEERKCVFLNSEGLCKVYEVRPISCRKALLRSEPDICSSFNPQKISRVVSPICEVIDCAILNTVPTDTFPRMLTYVITQYESETANQSLSASP